MVKISVGGVVRSIRGAIYNLTAAPAAPRPLAWFRIGTSGVLLAQALLLPASLLETHGSQGILQGLLGGGGPLPSLGWIAGRLAPLGIGEFLAVRFVYATYLAGLLALLLGWHTRIAAAAAWATHLLLLPSWHLSSYGVDQFGTIALFYMLWMPVGGDLSLDASRAGGAGAPSAAARLSLTVLRLHLCVVYLSSGLAKASGEQWWNGEAIWRAVMQPQFHTIDLGWLAQAPWVAKTACWATMAVELGYAVFVWPRRTRRLWVALTVGLHAGIAILLGIVLFGAIMIVLTVSAFGVDERPAPTCDDRSLRGWLRIRWAG